MRSRGLQLRPSPLPLLDGECLQVADRRDDLRFELAGCMGVLALTYV